MEESKEHTGQTKSSTHKVTHTNTYAVKKKSMKKIVKKTQVNSKKAKKLENNHKKNSRKTHTPLDGIHSPLLFFSFHQFCTLFFIFFFVRYTT